MSKQIFLISQISSVAYASKKAVAYICIRAVTSASCSQTIASMNNVADNEIQEKFAAWPLMSEVTSKSQ